MGLGADIRQFRYLLFTSQVPPSFGQMFVKANTFTTTLVLGGLQNFEPSASSPNITYRMLLPLASRGSSTHPAARVAVIEFTGAMPPTLVTRRQSIPILVPARFSAYTIGMAGTFRGFPVRLVNKIDGRPDMNGGF